MKLVGDGFQVQVEVVGHEFADFGVFVVALERPGVFGGGCVDVDVNACFVG